MKAAIEDVASGQVTTAVRDTTVEGVEIKKTASSVWLKAKSKLVVQH